MSFFHYRTKFTSSEITTSEDEIVGVLSAYRVIDSDGEMTLPGSFAGNTETLPVYYEHNRTTVPLGIASLEFNETGVLARIKLNQDIQLANEVAAAIKQKTVKGLSWGGRAVINAKREITKVWLAEVSFVVYPANPHALLKSQNRSQNDKIRLLRSLYN